MTIREIKFRSSQGNAVINPSSSRNFVICDGADEDGKDAIVMDKVVGKMGYFLNNKHTADADHKVLKESEFGNQLCRTVLLDTSGENLELKLDCNRSIGTSFKARVTCDYTSGETEVLTVSPGDSIRLPSSDRINGDIERLQSIEVDIRGMELDESKLLVDLEGTRSTPSEEESSSDGYDELDPIGGDDSVEEEDSELDFKEIAENVASAENYDEAASKLSYLESGEAGDMMIREVVDVLDNEEDIPELVEKLEDAGDEQKLSAALVTHRLRDMITRCQSVGDIIFTIDSSNLRSDMMVYDRPHPEQTLALFVADLRDAEEEGEEIDVPEYCGLKKAVRTNIDSVVVDVDDPFEGTGFESKEPESPGVDMGPDAEPEGLGGDSGQPAAATPGAQAQMSEEESEDIGTESSRNGRTSVEDVIDTLVEAKGIDDAIQSLNMTAFREIEIPEGVDADREENEYTVDKIIEVLESEKRKPTGLRLQRVQHMKDLHDNLLPAIRAPIVAQTIQKSSTGMISGLMSSGELGQVVDDLRSINISSSDKIAATNSGYQVDAVQFGTIPSFISEIEQAAKEEASVQSSIQGIPNAGGIRRAVEECKVGEEETVADLS